MTSSAERLSSSQTSATELQNRVGEEAAGALEEQRRTRVESQRGRDLERRAERKNLETKRRWSRSLSCPELVYQLVGLIGGNQTRKSTSHTNAHARTHALTDTHTSAQFSGSSSSGSLCTELLRPPCSWDVSGGGLAHVCVRTHSWYFQVPKLIKGAGGQRLVKGFFLGFFSAGSLSRVLSLCRLPFSSTPASWSGRSSAARARSSLRSPWTRWL